MNLEFQQLPHGLRILKLNGQLDLAGVGQVETKFYAHCGGEQPRVIIDLSATGFVASLGLRLLLQSIKVVTQRGGRLLLLNPVKNVSAVLELSGLGKYIMHGTEMEAAASLGLGTKASV